MAPFLQVERAVCDVLLAISPQVSECKAGFVRGWPGAIRGSDAGVSVCGQARSLTCFSDALAKPAHQAILDMPVR
jgi:hypothetical protein